MRDLYKEIQEDKELSGWIVQSCVFFEAAFDMYDELLKREGKNNMMLDEADDDAYFLARITQVRKRVKSIVPFIYVDTVPSEEELFGWIDHFEQAGYVDKKGSNELKKGLKSNNLVEYKASKEEVESMFGFERYNFHCEDFIDRDFLLKEKEKGILLSIVLSELFLKRTLSLFTVRNEELDTILNEVSELRREYERHLGFQMNLLYCENFCKRFFRETGGYKQAMLDFLSF